jgi:hypothetical protein
VLELVRLAQPPSNHLGHSACVFADSADEAGCQASLVWKANEIQPALAIRDPAAVARIAIRAGDRELNPRVVAAESGAPHDRVRLEPAPTF